MQALRIQGGRPLHGEIVISGAKNSALPLMAATLLAHGQSTLTNIPDLIDVHTLAKVLQHLGADINLQNNRHLEDHQISINTPEQLDCCAPYDLVRTMRASFLVLGPLLARQKYAKVSLPGGCSIGARPVEQHLKALQKLGATIELSQGYVIAQTKNRLVGHPIWFDFPTVGGTENIMMAASLAQGTTIIHNAACEPEIVDLAQALNQMGAAITNAGTSSITIEGVEALAPLHYRVMPDRIEYGTFLIAGALAGQKLTILKGNPADQQYLIDAIIRCGIDCEVTQDKTIISRPDSFAPLHLTTAPHPGFPTDMQAQMITLLTQARGRSSLVENIFENRFMHIAELRRLGAKIEVRNNTATIYGPASLSGTTVMATDLRASASLILAGLIAQGQTTIRRIYHLDRGYEKIDKKLQHVGASIERYDEE